MDSLLEGRVRCELVSEFLESIKRGPSGKFIDFGPGICYTTSILRPQRSHPTGWKTVHRLNFLSIGGGQAIGGLVQGLGGAFLEHLVYDANGQLLAFE
jgi:hypothetical protein